jgi:hypothetical protein
MMKIYIDVDDKGVLHGGWGTTPLSDKSIEVEIDENHPLLESSPRNFLYIDGQIIHSEVLTLNKAKAKKDAELNEMCKQEILSGFIHKIDGIDYWFSFDYEAQSNFQGSRPILKEGIVPAINWTVRLGGKDGEYTRIPVDEKIMDELTVAILVHKDSNISRYRDELLPLAMKAETVEDVEKITWDYEPPTIDEVVTEPVIEPTETTNEEQEFVIEESIPVQPPIEETTI